MRTSILAPLAAALAVVAPTAAHVAPRAGTPLVIVGTVRDTHNAALPGASVVVERAGATTDAAGAYTLRLPNVTRGADVAVTARLIGYDAQTIHLRATRDTLRADFGLKPVTMQLSELVVTSTPTAPPTRAQERAERRVGKAMSADMIAGAVASSPATFAAPMARGIAGGRAYPGTSRSGTLRPRGDTSWNRPPVDREQYDRIEDNPFLAVASNPRSTFSVDVDRASYGNVRRFITQGQRPPADAVRIEELVNYFPYALPAPRGDDPVAITTEVAPAPWRPEHRLVRIALRARPIATASLPPSNLVFLIDVSGSMQDPNKLPLVKRSLRLLVDELREQDRVAIVVYAGAAGVVLPSTAGSEKARIAEAIDRLEAGGSTAGGEGLLLAYKVARENRIANGVNRVVLATDGDFNVGVSSDGALERLVEAKRAEGTYLTVLGFGTGNYQDAKMEKLAKRGNGNYAYVDDLAEARKTLVHELGATLHTVADDVKLQIEFNPVAVRGFRLIGYEDRLLRDEDFADDTKDAGDMGAGHVVTALYEIVPAGVTNTVTLRGTDAPRYGGEPAASTKGSANELLFVKLRYKRPGEATSRLLTQAVTVPSARTVPSDDFRFAASVAEFGMLLRGSEHKGRATVDDALALARGSLGADEGGYRAEFVRLVEAFRAIDRPVAARERR